MSFHYQHDYRAIYRFLSELLIFADTPLAERGTAFSDIFSRRHYFAPIIAHAAAAIIADCRGSDCRRQPTFHRDFPPRPHIAINGLSAFSQLMRYADELRE